MPFGEHISLIKNKHPGGLNKVLKGLLVAGDVY